jgi:transposase-like protein
MPQLHFQPSLATRGLPRCPKCQSLMMLVRNEPSFAGSDSRFECPKCEHVFRALGEDPIKSDMVGWLYGELRPPE